MGIIDRALKLRAEIDEVAATIPDENATNFTEFFTKWAEGVQCSVGDRVRHNDKLYKCLQAHLSQASWSPAEAPSLWAEILAGQGGTEIGEWTQPDSTNPYMKGDKVTHNGKTWECTIDNNVWEPGVCGWTEIGGE